MIYEHIFEQGRIGSVTMRNRIVMPGMSSGLGSPDGEVTDRLIRYYEERAQGGVGLIISEFVTIDAEVGKGAPNELRIDEDDTIPGLTRLVDAIHHHGAKFFIQLHHAGRQSNSLLTGGKQLVAPSPVTCAAIGEEPRELTNAEVKDIIQKFVDGAYRSKQAGADGVELHGAHGYLINQFLSPKTNLRTDEYGGSSENRMRFVEEIVRGIKAQCGNDFPVTIRLSVDEFDEGGMTVELSKEVARHLEKIGVDAIHASAGNYNSMETVIESPLYEEGWRVYLADEIKTEISIPVIAVGNIRAPRFVDQILAEGKADFVAIGRGHIADPEWVNKVAEGREQEIRMCISCMHCVYSKKGHIECSINVRAGRELELPEIKPVDEKHHVVVVGGGPGGMEAARVLTEKGYDVTLFEKKEKLGGQLNLVTDPVYRKKMLRYVDYLTNEMARLNVDVHLNTEATVDMIKAENPFAVLLATGGLPLVPDIEGVDLPNVHNYRAVKLDSGMFKQNKIAVLGSGMVCHSTTRQLAEQGNDVTLIEVPTISGSKIGAATRARLHDKLRKEDVEIITDHQVVKILATGVVVEDKATGEQKEVPVEHVIIAMGVHAYNPLEEPLKREMNNVFLYGDAAGFASLSDATRGGFEIAYQLESLVKEMEAVLK